MDPNAIELALRERIEQGLVAPGAVLKQEELAADFGVSRQPVRQALQRLLANGLVERRSDRSLAVSGLSPKQAMELLGLRIALETSALSLSLPKLDASILRQARHAANEIPYASDPAELEDLDILFHRLLYSRCGNERMLLMIEDFRREGRRIYRSQLGNAARRDAFHAEHGIILDACLRNDADRAVRELVRHLEGAGADFTEDPQ